MTPSRLALALPAAVLLAVGLACGGGTAVSSDDPPPDIPADLARAPGEPAPAAQVKPATPRPDGMKDNLALSTNMEQFPLLSGKANPDFTEGDPIVAIAKLAKPAGALAVASDQGDFVAVLQKDGQVLHEHAWSWPTNKFETNSPMLIVNLVPSKDLGGKGADWTPGFARALDALDGTHALTFQIESPHADPTVIAIADFTYTGGGSEDYGAYAQDLEDFMEGKGKYKPKPKAPRASGGGGGGGGGGITPILYNNCANNAKVVLTKPDGSKVTVRIGATNSKRVTVPIGTRLAVLDADTGGRMNQRLKVLDSDFYDGMNSKICN